MRPLSIEKKKKNCFIPSFVWHTRSFPIRFWGHPNDFYPMHRYPPNAQQVWLGWLQYVMWIASAQQLYLSTVQWYAQCLPWSGMIFKIFFQFSSSLNTPWSLTTSGKKYCLRISSDRLHKMETDRNQLTEPNRWKLAISQGMTRKSLRQRWVKCSR